MKKIAMFSLLICLVITSTQAQNFQDNIEESLVLAHDAQKNVLIIFSGSDWCKPCIQLKQNILTQEQFVQFSTDKLVLLEVDFPYRKKNKLSPTQQAHNEKLAEQYNQEGRFPKVILLSPNQKVLGQINYKKNISTQEFIAQINAITK